MQFVCWGVAAVVGTVLVALVASCHPTLPVEPPYSETITDAGWYRAHEAPPDPPEMP